MFSDSEVHFFFFNFERSGGSRGARMLLIFFLLVDNLSGRLSGPEVSFSDRCRLEIGFRFYFKQFVFLSSR